MTNKYIVHFEQFRKDPDKFALEYFTVLKNNPQDLELIVEAFQPLALNTPQAQKVKVESEYNTLIKKYNDIGIKMPFLKANASESKLKSHITYWCIVNEKTRKDANDWCKKGEQHLDKLYEIYSELVK